MLFLKQHFKTTGLYTWPRLGLVLPTLKHDAELLWRPTGFPGKPSMTFMLLFVRCCAYVVVGIQTRHRCSSAVYDIPHHCPFSVQHCSACCGELLLPLGGNCPCRQSDSRRASFSESVHKPTTCPPFCPSKHSQPAQTADRDPETNGLGWTLFFIDQYL